MSLAENYVEAREMILPPLDASYHDDLASFSSSFYGHWMMNHAIKSSKNRSVRILLAGGCICLYFIYI